MQKYAHRPTKVLAVFFDGTQESLERIKELVECCKDGRVFYDRTAEKLERIDIDVEGYHYTVFEDYVVFLAEDNAFPTVLTKWDFNAKYAPVPPVTMKPKNRGFLHRLLRRVTT